MSPTIGNNMALGFVACYIIVSTQGPLWLMHIICNQMMRDFLYCDFPVAYQKIPENCVLADLEFQVSNDPVPGRQASVI